MPRTLRRRARTGTAPVRNETVAVVDDVVDRPVDIPAMYNDPEPHRSQLGLRPEDVTQAE